MSLVAHQAAIGDIIAAIAPYSAILDSLLLSGFGWSCPEIGGIPCDT